MENKENEVKKCKHCQSDIPKKAKICPNCRKKQGGKLKFIIAWIFLIIIAIALIGGGDDSGDKEEKDIEYNKVDIQAMYDDLENNPAAAAEKYKDTYIEFSGSMDVIDSDLAYIGVMPTEGFHIVSVRCNLKDDTQKDLVKNATKGDVVTVKGKCTEVGEILGYTVDVKELTK